jgi:hypothetical protein
MTTAVRVAAAVAGGRRGAGTVEHPVDVDVAPGPVLLRTLVEAVVRAEVAAFRARAEQRTFLRVLTDDAIDDGLVAGVVRSGDDVTADRAEVDPDAAVATALLAHRDGLYRVIVDDRPVDDLDAVVDVRPDTRLLFLRLVALAGG